MVKIQRRTKLGVLAATLAIFLFAGLMLLAGSTSAAHLGARANANRGVGKTSAPFPCGAIGFSPPITATTGASPSGAAIDDFNRDGRPDLAISNYRSATGDGISVMLGNGDGTLQAQTVYTTGAFPYTIIAADFNSDGRPDLAEDNQTDSAVAVRLGNGDGTFRPQTTYSAGNNPVGLVAGDFNSDGRPDLATANYYGNSVSLMLGNGDGTFRPYADFAAGSVPYSVAVADFNHDGRLDLVDTNSGDATVSVFLGNGDGTLRPQAAFPTDAQPRSVATGDFDGDGRPDIVTANYSSNNISVLLGNGDGTFQPQIISTAGNGPLSITVADFSGEGRLDVAVANFGDGTVSALEGNGDGTFQPQAIFPAGGGLARVVAGDFNEDGRMDLATANSNDNTASVLLNNCTAVGSTPTATVIPGDFIDVPPGSPFYPYVECLSHRGIVSGYSDGTFRPGNNVTRGQEAKIVSLAAGYNDPPGAQVFEDIAPGSTFYDYIQRLASRGIIGGYACGGTNEPCGPDNLPYFRPGNNVTRGQISKITAIAAGLPAPPQGQQSFTDVPVGSTFWTWIESLATAGSISGYPCGGPGEPCDSQQRPYFRVGNSVTRGQSAKIVASTFFPGCQSLVGNR